MDTALQVAANIIAFTTLIVTILTSDFRINNKSRIDAAEKLNKSIAQNDPLTSTEAFKFLFGKKLNLNFNEIKSICAHGDYSELTYCLRNLPGLCEYSNGKISFHGPFVFKGVRVAAKIYAAISAITMALFLLYLAFQAVSPDINQTLAALIVSLIPVILLVISINMFTQISRLIKLVEKEDNLTPQSQQK